MTPQDVEAVYEALALTLDEVPADRKELFLAKLALLLSHEIGDANRVLGLIKDASANLNV